MGLFYRAFLFVIFLIPALERVQGQTTVVKGTVTDKRSGESLGFATVSFSAKSRGVLTDDKGMFELHAEGHPQQLVVTVIGYKTAHVPVKEGVVQTIDVALEPDAAGLQEFVVTNKKTKYRNKDNPAVELIRQVIAHKDENRMQSCDYTEYSQYERLTMSLAHLTDSFRNKRFLKPYQFLFKTQDSAALGGKLLLPLYMEEKSSSNYFRRSPSSHKQIIRAFKQVKYDEDLVDNNGLSTFLNWLYQDMDIYDNNILLLTNQLLSPIANSGPSFYQYYLHDTIQDAEPKLIKLSFRPRNTTDLLFEGTLYITLDGRYAVKEAILRTNRHINLNFVKGMETRLSFEQDADGRFQLDRSDSKIDFGITKGKRNGMMGERLVIRDSLSIHNPRPASVYSGLAVETAPDADNKDSRYWSTQRSDSADTAANAIYHNLDSMQTIPSYKRTMTVASLLLSGYKGFGKFEIGPLNSFYSFNPVEGSRPRIGGRTTTAFSQRYYFEGYAAYGTKDERWKYYLSTTYSLNSKSIYTFPQQYIQASYLHDTRIPGLDLSFVQANNFLLSFNRGNNDQWTYNDIFRLDYLHESENHLSYGFGFKHWTQSAAGSLSFTKEVDDQTLVVPTITTSELSFNLRYAPHEKFYQGKVYRTPIVNQYPVINLRYSQGIKGLAGGQYDYKNITLNITKRFYLSQLGYTTASVEGGYIFGQLPYPLLTIHRANQTYSLQPQAYNLMNFLEFVSDHYAALNVEHCFNGFIFNKIPVMKRLKWREIVGAKFLWGGLRNENNPAYNSNQLQFPSNTLGQTTTFTLQNGPYIEGSVGIGNIFRLLRIDLVKRFTYLNNPSVSPIGIRGLIKFDF